MSTSETPHPSSGDPDETTVAAEPGSGGPRPEFAEEPDVLVGSDNSDETIDDNLSDDRPPFRTPTPGDRLSPGELESDAD
jgi:hypothetical protein